MAVAERSGTAWHLDLEPVGDVATLLPRLRTRAAGAPIAFGIDCPIGLPRAYAALHAAPAADFPAFLARLPQNPTFLDVAAELHEVSPARPFYPHRGRQGMSRLSHAQALGLPDAAALSRACDRATHDRPAGAPMFWTLGANQSGKAAIAAWRDLLLPAIASPTPPALWPFHGPFRTLLRPGTVAIAEAYPADALRQLGLRPIGSKRRHADRTAMVPNLRTAMATAAVRMKPALAAWMDTGFGPDPAGEDRMDCTIGALAMLQVVTGTRPDTAPDDEAIQRWEGWVLGQRPP